MVAVIGDNRVAIPDAAPLARLIYNPLLFGVEY